MLSEEHHSPLLGSDYQALVDVQCTLVVCHTLGLGKVVVSRVCYDMRAWIGLSNVSLFRADISVFIIVRPSAKGHRCQRYLRRLLDEGL